MRVRKVALQCSPVKVPQKVPSGAAGTGRSRTAPTGPPSGVMRTKEVTRAKARSSVYTAPERTSDEPRPRGRWGAGEAPQHPLNARRASPVDWHPCRNGHWNDDGVASEPVALQFSLDLLGFHTEIFDTRTQKPTARVGCAVRRRNTDPALNLGFLVVQTLLSVVVASVRRFRVLRFSLNLSRHSQPAGDNRQSR